LLTKFFLKLLLDKGNKSIFQFLEIVFFADFDLVNIL
jgi:hypothetical protein